MLQSRTNALLMVSLKSIESRASLTNAQSCPTFTRILLGDEVSAEAWNERSFKAQHYDAHQRRHETLHTPSFASGFMNIWFHKFYGESRDWVASDTPRRLLAPIVLQ